MTNSADAISYVKIKGLKVMNVSMIKLNVKVQMIIYILTFLFDIENYCHSKVKTEKRGRLFEFC